MNKTLSALLVATTALMMTVSTVAAQKLETITLAGGCFWCVESDFDKVPGVVETVSGFTGGAVEDPTYGQVTAGGSGHLEAVEITYDSEQVTFEELLTVFWRSIDPLDAGGQFCDRGESYTTAVFVKNAEERRLAEASKQAAADELGQDVVTTIKDAGTFYPAEDYHQNYHQRRAVSYRLYRWSCQRNQRVEELWGDSAYKGIPGHS